MKWFSQLSVFLVVALVRVGVFAAPAATNLTENRILLFNDYAQSNTTTQLDQPWVLHEGSMLNVANYTRALLPGTNHFHRAGWRLTSCRAGTVGGYTGYRYIPPFVPIPTYPAIATNLAGNLRNDTNAVIESAVLTNGVGTIYFEAVNARVDYPTDVAVDISTNLWDNIGGTNVYTLLPAFTNNMVYVWKTLCVSNLAAATSNDFMRYVNRLNLRMPVKVRIRRPTNISVLSSKDDGFAVVDNIRLSPPPTDVRVYNVSAFNQAGSHIIRCFVSNVDTNVSTDSRAVTAYYRWTNLANAWTNSAMVLQDAGDGHGNGERYDLELPEQLSGGDLEYYVICNFGGYMYQSPDYTLTGYTNYLSEGLSPFTTSMQTQHLAGVDLYLLTVVSGTGGGSYTNGAQVTISASNVVGKGFACWTGATQYLASAFAQTTVVTMPAIDVAVTATYTNSYYALTVNSGSGSGSYTNGQVVSIAASNVAGKVFDRWTGATQYVNNVSFSNALVTMPPSNIEVTASYVDVHTLTVSGGSGSGTSYTNGQQVVIVAAAPEPGKMFYRWTGSTAYVGSVTSATAVVTMPNFDIAVTATYIDVYSLIVISGSGSGTSYTNGQQVVIKADPPGASRKFYRWTGDTLYVADVAASNTVVTMPAANIMVSATYIDYYTLSVTNGTGTGSYTNGQEVAISAAPAATGMTFTRWGGATQYVADALAPSTTVTMPPLNIGLTAIYSNLFYTLTVNSGTGSGEYTNGQVVGISATIPFDKTFVRWSGDTTYLAGGIVTSATTTVTMPTFDIAVSALFSSQTSVLSDDRFLHFNDYVYSNTAVLVNQPWVLHEGPLINVANYTRALLPGTNHFHRTGWRLISCRAGTVGGYTGYRYVPPFGPIPTYPGVASNLAANLRNDTNAVIESPVFTNGVGTIYFEAINARVEYQVDVAVDISTQMYDPNGATNINTLLPPSTNGLQYVWDPVSTLHLAAATSNDFTRYNNRLNFRGPAKIRIRRLDYYSSSGKDDCFAVVDNIRVSPPPSDVIMDKTSAPFEPGFPGVGTNITVRCYVSNTDANVPTDSRTPKVIYRWRYLNQVIDSWRTNAMTYVGGSGDGLGNGELYQAALSQSPFTQVGDLEYYFVCDFGGYEYQSPDYTGLNYKYPAENLSPRTFRYDSPGHEFTTRLRPYASKYDKLYVVADDTNLFPNPIEMTVIGDHEWRGLVPIAGTGLSNLVWRFKGEGEYVADSGQISNNVTYWGGVSGITNVRVPYGGMCAVTNETGFLSVRVDKGNYVFLTLNTETLQYIATRGEYQNFNLWPAPVNVFTESNGQDPKHNYLNTFDSWPTNNDRVFMQAFVGYPLTTNTFSRDPFFTLDPECVAASAAYVSERTLVDNTLNAPTNTPKFRNVAMRLKGGDGALGLGYIHTRVATKPDGLKEVKFRGRAGQKADNFDVCYYRDGFTNFNYMVRATAACANFTQMSPENPSISLIGYYQDAWNFYEFRVTQINDTRDSAGSIQDMTVRFELYKWRGGVATRLGSFVDAQFSSQPLTQLITDSAPLEIGFYNQTSPTAGTVIKCRFANTDRITVTDSSNYLTRGTLGYFSSECRSVLSNVRIQGTLSTGAGNGTDSYKYLRQDSDDNFNADSLNWVMPPSKYEPKNGVPRGIYSLIPSQQIGIYLQPTDYDGIVEPDGADSSAWKLIKTITVTNYTYQAVTVPVTSWKSQFVMLEMMGGSADVIVDEFSVSSWHAQRNGLGWADIMQWVAYESWVVTNTSSSSLGNTVYLDHSRADPAEEQSIRSQVLTNGMGLMEFDYRVLNGPAKLTVQYAPRNDLTDWRDIQSFVAPAPADWQHATAYFGTNAPGFFRVLNAREGIYTNALVEINNANIWDEPTLTNNSWRAYNVKITLTDTNRVALDESKACFLNCDKYLEAEPPQTVFNPYLRSPELPKGLGKITFNARAYTNNQAATLFLYASTNGWNAADNLWFEVARFENITNGFYKLFSYEPVDGRSFDAVKLGTLTRSTDRRVCLEDVAITEPVLPGFEIVDVQLMSIPSGGSYEPYDQPVEGEEVHVSARIDNFQMIPSNIQMYVSYYVGSNHWGIGNWPANEMVIRALTNDVPGDPTLYRTVPRGTAGLPLSMTGGIADQDRDKVVQYYVWAEYDGGVHLFKQQETFVNPDWYYPIDLNVQYGQQGWSPYYFVYGVARNSVWINEVNATDYVEVNGVRKWGFWDNPYIEIAVPYWLDLAGWRVEIVQNDYQVREITIPSGLPAQTANTNGYAFFVIGDAFPKGGVPALPKLDYGYPDLSSLLPSVLPGGIRLKRPLGMYERSITYDFTNTWGGVFSGEEWAANEPADRKTFLYAGMENNGGSLGVLTGSGLNFTDWYFPMGWTPGSVNLGQIVQNGDSLYPGVSNVLVSSTMNLTKATQNGKRVNYYSLKMRLGMSTNIVYQTDPWYRLYSVKKDLVEQLPMVTGTMTNFVLDLPELKSDVGVTTEVGLRPDIAEQNLDADVLNWVLGFEDGVLIPMYYNDRVLTLTEQYWLDANPTRTNTFELAVSKFVIDPGTNFHVTVKMALNGEKKSSLQGGVVLKLEAKSRLFDSDWELILQYSLDANSFDADGKCRVFVPNPFDYIMAGSNPQTLFFRWVIEYDDPRVSTQLLTNDPEP